MKWRRRGLAREIGAQWVGAIRRWAPWFALLLAAATYALPPGVLVTLGPAQTVQTTNPKVGIHTRLTDEVEEWKIQRSLVMVREMGAPWIVEYFPWAYLEPQPGNYGWGHSDMVIDHALNQGLTVIARLGMTPDWARPDPAVQQTTATYLDAEHYADFAAFVGEFVRHYRGKVQHIIIWNEPNLSFEWGYRPVDAAAYTELLRAAYTAAHAANPDIIVLGGALAPTLEPVGSPAGLNDLLYLEAMYAAGAGEAFDALAAHTYGFTFAPDMAPAADLINFRRVELLRVIMEQHGDAAKPIYITEAGWNDHPRWVWRVKPAQRIRYTLDAYTWAQERWPWCPALVMWMFRTPMPLHQYQDYYTYVNTDFRTKMIYQKVQEYTGNSQEPTP